MLEQYVYPLPHSSPSNFMRWKHSHFMDGQIRKRRRKSESEAQSPSDFLRVLWGPSQAPVGGGALGVSVFWGGHT